MIYVLKNEACGITENDRSISCFRWSRLPASLQSSFKHLVRRRSMVPDGDRRHDSESGGIVHQIDVLIVVHDDVMAEFVLSHDVLHDHWRHLAREPVHDSPDGAMVSQNRLEAGECSGFELCSILDRDSIVHEATL